MTIKPPRVTTVDLDRLDLLTPFELTDHLERGRILLFPTPPLALPPDDDLEFLKRSTSDFHTRKDISFYPRTGRMSGIGGAPTEVEERTRDILAGYQRRVEDCLRRLIPSFTPEWRSATSSLRVFEENNRAIPIHARSDRIHLDAGTYGASRGDMILRFLTNLDERERVWRCKGTVFDLVHTLGEAAGLARDASLLEDGLGNRIGSSFVRGLAKLFPVLATLEQSAYDRSMRKLDNYMKENDAFQEDPQGAVEIRFPPKSCWLVFAGMTGHACLSGEFAMINTFMVPRQNFRHPELSPRAVLDRYAAGEAAWPPGVPVGI